MTIVAVVLALVIAVAGWAAFAPIAPGPREMRFVIPKGTAARIAAGQTAQALPSRIRLTVGVRDLLILRNDDDQPQSFGPVLLAAGQTYRVPFSAPATFDSGLLRAQRRADHHRRRDRARGGLAPIGLAVRRVAGPVGSVDVSALPARSVRAGGGDRVFAEV